MAKSDKKDYKDEYLDDFKMISGMMDLTLQDVYGAMCLLIRDYEIGQSKAGMWSKNQYDFLYRYLMDGDDFYKTHLSNFKKAVDKTRYDRTHRFSKKSYDEDIEVIYDNPEEDMDAMSQELLKNDDVFYESWKSEHQDMFIFS